jgi:hypothetical protein
VSTAADAIVVVDIDENRTRKQLVSDLRRTRKRMAAIVELCDARAEEIRALREDVTRLRRLAKNATRGIDWSGAAICALFADETITNTAIALRLNCALSLVSTHRQRWRIAHQL